MSRRNADLVTAEMLLRRVDPTVVERVRTFLEGHGVEVSAVGATSISIRCPRAAFERIFRTRLTKTRPARPRAGVQDFGPLRRQAFRATAPISVPDEIAEEVEGVYVQEPPRLL